MTGSRLEAIEKRAREHPEDVFANYALAMEYASAGRVDDAIDAYRALHQRRPDYLATYYQLGKLLAQAGRREEAREVFDAGVNVARRAGNEHTLNELQEALSQLG